MNVYRPYGTMKESNLPILVMIHGGSWQGGSAFGPGWEMLKKARDQGKPFIHIGIQYRLNAFGLLASEGMDQEGTYGWRGRPCDQEAETKIVLVASDLNAALSDQQAALRFIKKNAHRMGGDPEKIVLGGQSAGASGASLNWLYSDPEEKRKLALPSGYGISGAESLLTQYSVVSTCRLVVRPSTQ